MDWRLSGLAFLTLTLAACGSDSGDAAQAEQIGVFRAGGVSGIQYSTPTRSGVTDLSGTFRYLPGENVAFSIGGITLGSAPGAAVITPFTLAGLSPPTTERALRLELDRTTRMATPLGRAINIATLLLWLDADHDSRNGIDVTNRASALAGVRLDTGLAIGPFSSTLQRTVPDLTANLPYSRSLVHLYHSLNISVPAHADTRADTTYPNGFQSSVKSNSYGTDGSHASQIYDNDGDGEPDSTTTWTFDPLGRIKSFSTKLNSLLEPAAYFRDVTYEFDARGIATRYVEEYQYDAWYGVSSRDVHRVTVDGYGFPLSDVMDIDSLRDGTVDTRLTTTYSYDSQHNMLSMKTEVDYELDGTVEESTTSTMTYDGLGRMRTRVDEYERTGDGAVEERYATSYEYGSGAGAVREVSTTDTGADGVLEARYVVNRTYDGAGYLLSQDSLDDLGADGVADGAWHVTYTYDGQQRLLTQSSHSDYDGDGTLDNSDRATYVYDDIGNLLSSEAEYDFFGDGEIDAHWMQTFRYGASGELLSAASAAIPGPVFELVPSGSTTVTNIEIPDGVLLLAQRYLDRFSGVVANYPGGSSVAGVTTLPFAAGGASAQ